MIKLIEVLMVIVSVFALLGDANCQANLASVLTVNWMAGGLRFW